MKPKLSYSTRRLILRPLTLGDFAAWLLSQQKTGPAVDKFDVASLPLRKRSRSLFRQSVNEQKRRARKDQRYVFNAFLKRTGELVGFLDIKPISREPHKMADIGYFITNSYRGNGYAKEALRRLVRAAFDDLLLHRLEAVIDLDNKASIAVAKRSGFYREGIKKHYWFQHGRWEDQIVFIATPELFS